MPYLLVKQKVKNFDNWYAVFKSEAKAQKEAGLHDLILMHDIYDPNIILCLFKADDLERARAYTNSPNYAKSLKLLEETNMPEVIFLDKV